MTDFFLAASGCLLLGIMTTLHPCPLTANVAAISFLSGTARTKKGQLSVLLYFGLGYTMALTGLAALVNFGLLSIPRLSLYLQSVFSAFLGPMLILTGMVLTGMIKLGRSYWGILPGRDFWKGKPPIYILPMGVLLALSFCPATAFIYFGLLIPMSVDSDQVIIFPLLYAVGALVPILVISLFITRGITFKLEDKWTVKIPNIAGWLLILGGIYIALEQLYF